MRVAVDGRALARGRGIGRYAATMLRALIDRHPDDRWEIFSAPGATIPGAGTHRSRVPQQLLFGAAAIGGRPRLDRMTGPRPDVVWLPAPAPVAISRGVPYVLTLHDLSWAQRPQDFTRYEQLWHRLARIERLARRATIVVCDSAATRDAALARWPGLAAPRVVAPGVAPLPPPRRDPRLPARYLLCVGALEPRKAPQLLARAHAAARRDGLDAELVFAGSGRLAGALRADGVHVLGDLDDAALAAAYAGALALVMPTLLEGFGLPPLEARALGTPAIVSDLPVFRETLGDGALYVPAGDEAALTRALLRAPTLPRPRPENRFTPEAAADALHAALSEAAR